MRSDKYLVTLYIYLSYFYLIYRPFYAVKRRPLLVISWRRSDAAVKHARAWRVHMHVSQFYKQKSRHVSLRMSKVTLSHGIWFITRQGFAR